MVHALEMITLVIPRDGTDRCEGGAMCRRCITTIVPPCAGNCRRGTMRTEASIPHRGMGHGTESTGSRRQFLQALVGLSLCGPLVASRFATAIPMTPRVRMAQAPWTPPTRGGGGTL